MNRSAAAEIGARFACPSVMTLARREMRVALASVVMMVSASSTACQQDMAQASANYRGVSRVAFAPPAVARDEQRRVLLNSAKTAWNYFRRNTSASSGLVRALDTWDYVTIWDIGSTLGAIHSARGLNLIDEAEYRRRADRILRTLETMPIYHDVAFNKQYASRNAQMVGKDQKVSATGFGWSALDMGRFLVWMKIIAANDSAAAPVAQRIVARLNLQQMVGDGYLLGANTDPKNNSHHDYPEGKIGYEQYAAAGFAQWGARAEKAIDFSVNGKPAEVYGFRVLADKRGDDLLTSEPFIMMGMELGWTDPTWEELARNVLAAQRERFARTGTITMVSEDAVPVKPAYFYYYLLHRNGQNFVVRAPGGQPNPSFPRWISTKAAFGWHALFPSDYTWQAVNAVLPAGTSGNGWSAGVYERSKRPTPAFNLNTAAIVLEAAYYSQRGCPLIRPTCK